MEGYYSTFIEVSEESLRNVNLNIPDDVKVQAAICMCFSFPDRIELRRLRVEHND